MTQFVAFLRGINLGKRRVKMNELAELFEELDSVDNVATFIASGNVVFESDASEEDLAAEIELHLQRRLGYDVDTFVRSMEQLKQILQLDVFPNVDASGRTLHVIFLREAPAQDYVEALRVLQTDDDHFAVRGREVFWLRNGRLSDSPIPSADLARSLGSVSTTMRNMNTVARIADKFGSGAGS